MSFSSAIIFEIALKTKTTPPDDVEKLPKYLRKICKNTQDEVWNQFSQEAKQFLDDALKSIKFKKGLPFPPDLKSSQKPAQAENDDIDQDSVDNDAAMLEDIPDAMSCYSKKKEIDLPTFFNYLKNNIIVIPEYQREFSWSPKKRTAFLESYLRGIPITDIFLAIDPDNDVDQFNLIDGQQRIMTLKSFYEGKEVVFENADNPKGFKFNQLSPKLKKRFRTTAIPVVEIYAKEEYQPLIFRKINIAPTPLNDIEVKRATFRKNPLIGELEEINSNNEIWKTLFGLVNRRIDTRKRGLNSLLRAVAMHYDYESYTKGMAAFEDSFLAHSKHSKEIEVENDMQIFIRKLDLIFKALNDFSDELDLDHNFKKKKKKLVFRVTQKSQVNLGLVDCLVHAGLIVQEQGTPQIKVLAKLLKQVRTSLLTDPESLKAITCDTSGRISVITRMKAAEKYARLHIKSMV